MPSTPVVNAIGALGGAVLAACLLPQIYRLYRTRSARDLAYLYLAAYATGLFLTFLYLYWEGATVAWICILIEMGFAIAVMGAKVYLDNYGPHSRRGKERSAADANDQAEDVKSPGESDNPSVQCLGDQDQTRSSLRMRDAEVLAKGSTAHKRDSIASLA